MFKLILFSLLVIGATAWAGHSEGNGGDMCENRFKVAREDLSDWILRGGARALKLPSNVSYLNYAMSMDQNIRSASISCTDQEITIGGNSKTCANYVDENRQRQILCNAQRFLQLDEQSQYVIVHHEYAGLSGFEVTVGGDSDYSISNQISASLANQVVKKLAVRADISTVCRENEIIGTFEGRFDSDNSRPSFPVKIVIFPAKPNPASENSCPEYFIQYSRPDLKSGAGTMIGNAKLDLTTSQLILESTRTSTGGVPGHQFLYIRTDRLDQNGFEGQMQWWDRVGRLRMTKTL